jgi:hypothetical protein
MVSSYPSIGGPGDMAHRSREPPHATSQPNSQLVSSKEPPTMTSSRCHRRPLRHRPRTRQAMAGIAAVAVLDLEGTPLLRLATATSPSRHHRAARVSEGRQLLRLATAAEAAINPCTAAPSTRPRQATPTAVGRRRHAAAGGDATPTALGRRTSDDLTAACSRP